MVAESTERENFFSSFVLPFLNCKKNGRVQDKWEHDLFPDAYYFLNHLFKICCENTHLSTTQDYLYLVKYVAKVIQTPMKKNEGDGLILYSKEEGVGKSFAAQMIIDMLSPFSRETSNSHDIFSKFALLQENAFLIHLEDSDASEMKGYRSYFKNRTTSKTITIERKNQDKRIVQNLCRYLITTNDLNGVPISSERDRRFAIIECSSQLRGNLNYFKKLDQQWAKMAVRKNTFLFLDLVDLSGFSCESSKPNNEIIKEVRLREIDKTKRFLIGISFWFAHESKISRDFKNTHGKKVKIYPEESDWVKEAIWFESKILFSIY